MSRRVYGTLEASDYEQDIRSVNESVVESVDDAADSWDSLLSAKDEKRVNMFVVLMSCICVGILVFGLVFYFVILDSSHGSMSASDAAHTFISRVMDVDSSALSDCVPRRIREHDILIDDVGISEMRGLMETDSLQLSSITVNNVDQITDLDSVDRSIMDIYDEDMSVSDAAKISIGIKGQSLTSGSEYVFDADVVCVKSGFKWYVIPGLVKYGNVKAMVDESIGDHSKYVKPTDGNTVSDSDVEDPVFSADSVSSSQVSMISYREPVVKDVKEIKSYKGIMKDVTAGKVSIDDIDYVFPVSYSDISSLFKYVYSPDGFSSKLTIEPNYIVNNVPIVFCDDRYGKVQTYVSVGNMTDKSVSVDDAFVTSFYIAVPDSTREYQVFDYPDVYLPGNVTFGTPFASVEECYDKLEKVEDTKDVPVKKDGSDIYSISLNNDMNKLYLEFYDDKLVGIEWYYFDFEDFMKN